MFLLPPSPDGKVGVGVDHDADVYDSLPENVEEDEDGVDKPTVLVRLVIRIIQHPLPAQIFNEVTQYLPSKF